VEARTRIDTSNSKLYYDLAALHAMQSQNDDALQSLAQAIALDPTNAPMAAKMDANFGAIRDDPRFQNLVNNPPTNAAPTNAATPEPPKGMLKKPLKK
jgi:hypothetical protein